VELEQQKEAYAKRGLGVAAISYDSVATLQSFAARKGISYPLLSDPGSKIIRTFGILNESFHPGQLPYGVPYPGMYIVDEHGIVRAKYFETDYVERDTAASILVRQFGANGTGATEIETPQLKLVSSASDATVSPGNRITLVVDLDLKPRMHVYAPGVTGGYIPIDWQIAASPSYAAQPIDWPQSHMLNLPVIHETVPVYTGQLRLTRDVTIAQPIKPGPLTVEGTFRYQACDDKACYPPRNIPLKWTFQVEPLDRQRAPR